MSVWPLPRISIRELNTVQETRPVALLTTAEAWAALNTRLALPVVIQAEPARLDRELVDYLAANLPSRVKAIYAVGSGAPVETGKVIASRNNVPLIVVPTALDSILPLLPVALVDEVVEDRKRRVLLETGPAAELILDWEMILAAPETLRGAGIADVMSIITGLLDWRFAAQKGKNPREQRFMPWAAGVATDLAKEAIKNSGPIGQGQSDALRTLLNLMMLAVQLSNQLGHMRVQQGSEHYLGQVLGAESAQGMAYAELVGPCLLFTAALHGQDPAPLRDALQHAGVRLDQLRATDFNLMIDNLDGHLTDYGFPYSILNETDPQSDAVAKALESAGLAILADTWKKLEETQPLSAVLETPQEAQAETPEEVPAEEPVAAAAEAEAETAPAAVAETPAETDVEATPQADIETQAAAAIADTVIEEPPVAEKDNTQPTEGTASLSHG